MKLALAAFLFIVGFSVSANAQRIAEQTAYAEDGYLWLYSSSDTTATVTFPSGYSEDVEVDGYTLVPIHDGNYAVISDNVTSWILYDSHAFYSVPLSTFNEVSAWDGVAFALADTSDSQINFSIVAYNALGFQVASTTVGVATHSEISMFFSQLFPSLYWSSSVVYEVDITASDDSAFMRALCNGNGCQQL